MMGILAVVVVADVVAGGVVAVTVVEGRVNDSLEGGVGDGIDVLLLAVVAVLLPLEDDPLTSLATWSNTGGGTLTGTVCEAVMVVVAVVVVMAEGVVIAAMRVDCMLMCTLSGVGAGGNSTVGLRMTTFAFF